MNSFLSRLISWFNSTSSRTKWILGLVGVCVIGMAGLLMLSGGSPYATTDSTHDPLNSSPALFFDVFLKLGGVLVLIAAGAFLLRRWQTGSFRPSTRQLSLVESLRLSQRQALHIIRAGNQVLLIGATDQSLTLISSISLDESAVEAASGQSDALINPVVNSSEDLAFNFKNILKKKI